MTHPASFIVPKRRAGGAGLVTAIFLLVVLAGLGVALVSVFTSQQASSTLDEQGARAYQAARAGIEWGLFQRLRNNSCVNSSSFQLPSDSTLAGFTVTVRCEKIKGPKDASGDEEILSRWQISATACNQPAGTECTGAANKNSTFVQRRLEVQI